MHMCGFFFSNQKNENVNVKMLWWLLSTKIRVSSMWLYWEPEVSVCFCCCCLVFPLHDFSYGRSFKEDIFLWGQSKWRAEQALKWGEPRLSPLRSCVPLCCVTFLILRFQPQVLWGDSTSSKKLSGILTAAVLHPCNALCLAGRERTSYSPAGWAFLPVSPFSLWASGEAAGSPSGAFVFPELSSLLVHLWCFVNWWVVLST